MSRMGQPKRLWEDEEPLEVWDERRRLAAQNAEPYRWWTDANPYALRNLLRHESAMELMFEGFRLHWRSSVTTGRPEVWADAVTCAARLLVSLPDTPFARRAELSS